MMNLNNLILFSSFLIITSCSITKTRHALKIHEVKSSDYKELENCKFLKELSSTSGWGMAASTTGIQNAKNTVLNEAAELGATHVLWKNITSAFTSSAVGKAYKCN